MPYESLQRKAYLGSLILIAVTLPTKWIQLNSLAIIFLLTVTLSENGFFGRVKKTTSDKSFFWLCSFFFVSALSLVYTRNQADGLSGIETKMSLVVFPLILLSAAKLEKHEIDLVLICFMTSCVFVSLLCVGDTFYSNHLRGLSYTYSTSWFYSADNLIAKWGFHPSYFSTYCGFCVFIAIYLIKKKKLDKIFGWILILYLFLFQLLLASRVAIFSVVIVFTFLLIHEAWLKGKIWSGVGLASVVLFSSIVSLYSFGTMKDKVNAMLNYRVNRYNEAFKIDGRLNQWRSSLIIIKDNFLLGVGIGDRKDELEKLYVQSGYVAGYRNRYDSHNVLLEAGVTAGVLGILTCFFLFIFSFYRAISTGQFLHLQFLLLFSALSFVEASLSVQKGVVFFALINTLFLSSRGDLKNELPLQK